MKVVVTGGAGKAGRACVVELNAYGHEVTVVDRAPLLGSPQRSMGADLTEFGQVIGALEGAEGVVHLAAIPAPGLYSNAHTFRNNTLSDYNVFEACRVLGIKNVAYASSETVLGLPFDVPPPYVPLDEEYAGRPESAYSLAKLLSETMAEQFCRWDPELKLFGLRFSNVMEPDDYARFPSFEGDLNSRRWNLWSYIDARDAAQAMRLALESPLKGAEVFVIANPDTVMSCPSQELMAGAFPNVPFKSEIDERTALMSSEKARRMLGFEPKFSWKDAV